MTIQSGHQGLPKPELRQVMASLRAWMGFTEPSHVSQHFNFAPLNMGEVNAEKRATEI